MPETPFQLSRISVVMLGVQKLDRAVAFYRDKLGLAVQGQIPGFIFLDGGGVPLVLSEPLARATGAGPGATEVVFAVDGVREAYEALRQRGVEFTHTPRVIDGTNWGANFTDPDGHRLSIFGPERKD